MRALNLGVDHGAGLHVKRDVGAVGRRIVVGGDEADLRRQMILLHQCVLQVLRGILQFLQRIRLAGADGGIVQAGQVGAQHALQMRALFRGHAVQSNVAKLRSPAQMGVEENIGDPMDFVSLYLGSDLRQEVSAAMKECLQRRAGVGHIHRRVSAPRG